MSADVVLRYRSDGAAQASAEARGLGRTLDGLKNRRFDVDTSRAVGAMDRWGASAARVGQRLDTVGRTASRFITAPVVGGLALSVKAFADFDGAMTKSLAVMGKVSPGLRSQMEAVARGTAKDLGFAAKDVAAGFLYLGASGLSAQASMKALPLVAKTARAGLMDLETATTLLLDSQSALGLKLKDPIKNLASLTRVSDIFARSADVSNMSIEQMGEAITNKAGGALRFVKKPLEEGAAALAYMADQGVKGATAGEILSIGLRDIARAASANREAFKAQGIEVLDAQGNLKNLAVIADEFTEATAGMGDAQKYAMLDQLGLTRSVGDFIRAINGGGTAIRDYERQIASAGGYTEKTAAKQMAAFSMQMQQIRTRVTDAAISLGEVLAPGVLKVADAFAGFVDQVRSLPSAAQKAIGVAVGLAAALGPLAFVAGGAAKGVGAVIRGASMLTRLGGGGGLARGGVAAGGLAGGGVIPVFVTNGAALGLAGPGGGPLPGGAAGARRGYTATRATTMPLYAGSSPYSGMSRFGAPMIGGVPGAGILGRGGGAGPAVMPGRVGGVVPYGTGRFSTGGAGRMAGGALPGLALGAGVYGVARGAGAGQSTSAVLAGATTGATIGAMAGPQGAVFGALAGAAAGGLIAGFRKFGSGPTARETAKKAAQEFTAGMNVDGALTDRLARANADVNRARGLTQRSGMQHLVGGDRAGAMRTRADDQLTTASARQGQAAAAALSAGLKNGRTYQTAEGVTKRTLDALGKLEPGARQIAAKAAIATVREMERGGRVQRGTADKLVKAVTKEYGTLESTLPRSARKVAQRYAAEIKMDKAVKGAGSAMRQIGKQFEGAPKMAATTAGNVKGQYERAMAFLARRAKTGSAEQRQAARTMAAQVKAEYAKVTSSSQNLARAYGVSAAAMQAANTAGASSASALASAWEAAAARMVSAARRAQSAKLSASIGGSLAGDQRALATGGRVPGSFDGMDDRPYFLSGDEVVLNPTQQGMVPGGRAGIDNILRSTGGRIGGRSFATGGRPDAPPGTNRRPGSGVGMTYATVVVTGKPGETKGMSAEDKRNLRTEIAAAIRQALTENKRATGAPKGGSFRSRSDRAEESIAERARNNGLQDKRTEKAATDAASARGVTNPDKLAAEGEKAVLEVRKREIDADRADVVTAAARVQGDITTKKRGLKKLYGQLRKTSAFNRQRRDGLLTAIENTRQMIRDLYDEHRALIREAADLQATADEIGYDIGELVSSIGLMPDVIPPEPAATDTSSDPTSATGAAGETDAAAADRRSLAFAESFIRTGFGPGDIGSGGRTAVEAAGGRAPTVNVYTLIPSDPRTMAAIAAGVTGSLSSQAPRLTSTVVTPL